MHTVRKRLLAILLTLAMVVSLFPVTAFADAGEDAGSIAPVEATAPAEDLSPAEDAQGSIAPAGEVPEALPEKPVADEIQEIVASGTCGPNLTWTMTDNSLLISGDGEMDDFDSDAPWAVYSSNIQGITLPNYLTSIGDNAFRSCSALPAIDIPSGVTRIGSSAFADCTGLSTISFNGSAPTIEADSFQNVTATAYFTPDDTWYSGAAQNYGGSITWVEFQAFHDPDPYGTCGPNLTWTLDGDVLTISGEGRMDSWEPDQNPPPWDPWRDGISSVRILDGVTDIGMGAFAYFTSLTSVEIPGSVTDIYEMAFKDCSLREVTLPEGLQSIAWYAFTGSRLESVTFPASCYGVTDHAFEGCTSLKEAIFLDGPSSAQSIGEYAFSGCTALERVVLPDSVFQICSCAFAGCSNLQSIHLPKSLNESWEGVFSGCTALKELHFTGSLPSMLDLSYWSGTAYYPATDPSWANADLASFGGDVTWVPEYAIIASGYCGTEAELTNLTWKLDEAGLLTISGIGEMFDFTDDIIEFDGIAPVPMAGDSAAAIPSHDIINGETGPAPWDNYRSSIKEVIVETGVTGIGTNAFVSCNQITRVTIPDTVTRIGSGAFDGVSSVKHVFYAGTEDQRAQIRYGSNTGMQLLPNAAWHYGKTTADIVPLTVEPCEGVTVSADSIAVRGEKLPVEITVSQAYKLLEVRVNGTAIDLDTYVVTDESAITVSFVVEDLRIPITMEPCDGVSVTLLQNYALPGEKLPVEIIVTPAYKLTQVLVNGTAIDLETYTVSDESSITLSFVTEERYPGHGAALNSGVCGAQGDNLCWVFYEDGTLTIFGTGRMEDFESDFLPIDLYLAPGHLIDATPKEDASFPGADSIQTEVKRSAPWPVTTIHKVILEEGVTSIGTGAFLNGISLESVSFPSTLESCADDAFAFCDKIREIHIAGLDSWLRLTANIPTLPRGQLFINGEAMTNAVIPDGITSIPDSSFAKCDCLQSVSIPETVTSIESFAFSGCTGLELLSLPQSLTTIANSAFQNANGVEHVLYAGTEEQRTQISYGSNNGMQLFPNAVWHYGKTAADIVPMTVEACDGVTVSADFIAVRGEKLWVEISVDPVYRLLEVRVNGTAIDLETYVVTDETSITVSFVTEDLRVPITIEDCPGITVSPLGEDYVLRGDKLPLVYEVEPGFRLLEIHVNGTAIDLDTYLVTDETAITVSFVAEDLRVPITIEECPGITVSPLEKDYVMRYEKLSLVYEADPLYRLLEIRVNGTAIDLDTYVVTDEAAITVSFVTEERYSGHGAVLNSGYCGAQGDNLRWVYYQDRTLIIFGSGEMEDFEDYSLPPDPFDNAVPVIPGLSKALAAPGTARLQYATREAPWDGLNIDRLILEEGVTSVGANAFFGDVIRETDLPESIVSIGDSAFGWHQEYQGNDLYLIRFAGSAPNSGSGFYASIINLALYPKDDASWTEDFFRRSSSRITWVGYRDEATYNTVQYELNGGEGLSRQFKGHNVDLLLTSEVPTRTGYRFLGWATAAESQDVQFRPGDSYTRNEDLTLYAVWELERYTVSFDANGGEGAPEAVTKTYSQPLTLPETQPTRADDAAPSFTVTLDPAGGTVEAASLFALRTNHYSFQSWNTAPNGYGASYAPGGSYTNEEDVTLYAQWNVSTSTAPVDLPTPVRSHYAFRGWATSSSASGGITGSYTPGSDVTLYAIWELIPDGVLTMENTEGSHGKEITVPVDLSANPGLHYLSLQVSYDSSRMDLLGVEDGSLTGWKFTHETGILQWMPGEMEDSTEAGTVVTLRFQLYPTAADGNTEISVSVVDAVNLAEEKLVIFGTSALVYIHSRMPGDINGDDEVSILDLVRLLKHLAGESVLIHYQNADVTGDGEIDGADLVRLRKYLVGFPDSDLD